MDGNSGRNLVDFFIPEACLNAKENPNDLQIEWKEIKYIVSKGIELWDLDLRFGKVRSIFPEMTFFKI